MKVAVAQFQASTNKETNLAKILNYISTAAKNNAKLIAFPEFMMLYTTSLQTSAQLASQAETIRGDFVSAIRQSAKKHAISIVGTFYEKSTKKNRVYDSAFLISQSGTILETYKKIHLYDALGFRESNKMAPGSKISKPAKSSIGKIGMQICYDLRFPEMSRTLAQAGSEILAAPSAWVKGPSKEEHWLAINKTRAIENGCYVISPDQVGNIYCGRSLIVDPYGKVLLDMKKRQGLGYADIDTKLVHKTRKALPLLSNRRTDIYPKFRI